MIRQTLTLLVVSLVILTPSAVRGDTDDLFALNLKPNVLILMDGSGSMNDDDGGKYSVSYCTKWNGTFTSCLQTTSDLDVDGIDNTRNDTALNVVLNLLDANKDNRVNAEDEKVLGVRLGLMYYTSAGDSDDDDARPRPEIDYSFETIAPVGTPYADIKKAIIDPVLAKVPDPNIVVGKLRGCGASGSEDASPCNAVSPPVGYKLDDTPTAESLQYLEHYWWPQQLFLDADGVCRQSFIILLTDGASDGFVAPETVVASLYNNATPTVHGLGVPEQFKDRNAQIIPIPGTYSYQFTDKDSKLLIRDFTKQFAAGVTVVNVKLALDIPGASPPPSCLADCFAYDPKGGDVTKAPLASLGYVGGLDKIIYGNATKLENLTLLSTNLLDPEPQYFTKTFAVGFSGGDKGELDRIAQAGGTGAAFFPATFAELTNAIQSAMIKIQAETLSIAAPSVPAARSTSGDVLYLASFTPSDKPFWYGKLTAYPLNPDGTIATDATGAITAPPIWEAHNVLNARTADSRQIWTVTSGTKFEEFRGPNANLESAMKVTQDFDGNGVINSGDALWLLGYVRGTNGTDPPWKLGDLYHSSPLVIGPPSSAYVDLNLDRTLDTSFPLFRDAFKTRDLVIYTGGNAGMFHAFHAGTWQGTEYDTGTGAERWAFVPPNLHPKLQDMVSTHTFYVDGPPTAADVWLDGVSNDGSAVFLNNIKNPSGKEWHTVLIFGERRGGNAYVALDITDPGPAATPNPPKYLWTFTDPTSNLGETWSRPAIGKVRLSLDGGTTTIERWVAFVGGGYLPPSDLSPIGKAFFVIDINTGTKLWEYTVANHASMNRVPASPTPVDTDGDGFVDRVYVGDLSGNVWRFDLQRVGVTSGLGTLVSGWTGSLLFTAQSGHPFYNQLAVARDPVGNLYVYGGTGDLNDLLNETTLDRFYAIRELYPKASGTPPVVVPAVVTDADLADTTGVNTLNVNDPLFAGKLGWYVRLTAGEKVLSDAEVFGGVLLFTSFRPTEATCTKRGGTSTLYALSYLTGGGASDYTAFEQGTEGLSKIAATIGGLSSGPQISMPGRTSSGAMAGGDVVLFVCTSSEVCGNPPAPQPGDMRWVDFWNQIMQ